MKRTFVILFLLIAIVNGKAQFKYRGVGIYGALTQSAHYYKNKDTGKKLDDSAAKYHPEYFYPQTHISKEGFNWGAGIFVELGGPGVRWQSEIEYANKSVQEMEVIEPISGTRSGTYSKNKNTYIQWNNYAKFYNPLAYGAWYVMPGIRLEYLFRKAPTVFVPVSANFPQFWFSGDIGVGYEFPLFKKFSAFVEYHWNPDIIPHEHFGNTKVRNRTFELRVGLVMRPRKKSIDDCNAPVYRGPAY